jgi:hypothetical protein
LQVEIDKLPVDVQRAVRPWLGRTVVIVGDHPHADRVGFVDRLENTNAGYGFIVKCDDHSNLGDEFFVFNQKHWRVI